HAAQEVAQVIDRAGQEGRVAVIDNARLARRLEDHGREVVAVEADGALEERAFAAVVAGGLARKDDWQERLAGWCRAVVPGGLIVLVDRGQAAELSRRALCGGLTAVEQRAAGRVLVTSGRWVDW
ncbi:MAG TPA: hypothetical protein VKZ63_04380, partial [Kofleriaceae bacterium]|nr:hypothetical protein [Kofleriaceae bacterium]